MKINSEYYVLATLLRDIIAKVNGVSVHLKCAHAGLVVPLLK